MIATRQQIKNLLQITSSDYDAVITDMIPIVQSQIIDYCTNRFLDPRVYYVSSGIEFVAGSPATITDSESGFVTAHFYDGMDVFISGSYNNNGHFEVDDVAAGTLTLDLRETLVNEDESTGVAFYKVDFPKGLVLPFSKMINYNLQKDSAKGYKSKSLADYSVTFADVGGAEYPTNIVGGLKPYRRLKWQ